MYLTATQRRFLKAALNGIVKRYPTYASAKCATGEVKIDRKNAEVLIYDLRLIEPVYERPIVTAKSDISGGYYYKLTPAGRAEAARIAAEST